MDALGITRTALLSLLLGIAAPLLALQEQQEEKQDHPQPKQQESAKPQQQQQHAQQQEKQNDQQQQQHAQQQEKQNQDQQQQQHAQQQEKQNQDKQQQQHAQQQSEQRQQAQHAQQHGNNQPQRTQEQLRVEQSAWQEHRTHSWESDHRDWQRRGGYHGYRIPDDRYRGYFGENHDFRIYGLPFLVVGGYPRFQYEGYWFSTVDPWPEAWANDWYDTDQVYIVYVNNGYYMFNRRYPNVGLAVNISM